MELLDIGGSMGTFPRQESVPNSSMPHRELLKWHCWFASDRWAARARARCRAAKAGAYSLLLICTSDNSILLIVWIEN